MPSHGRQIDRLDEVFQFCEDIVGSRDVDLLVARPHEQAAHPGLDVGIAEPIGDGDPGFDVLDAFVAAIRRR